MSADGATFTTQRHGHSASRLGQDWRTEPEWMQALLDTSPIAPATREPV